MTLNYLLYFCTPAKISIIFKYEQIHDDLVMHAAMAYDFAFDYLIRHPHAHLKA